MLYDFRCKECDDVFTVSCHMDERNEPRKCNVCSSMNTERFIGQAPALGDAVRLGITTVDNGFREVLSKVHEKTYKSNLGDKLSR